MCATAMIILYVQSTLQSVKACHEPQAEHGSPATLSSPIPSLPLTSSDTHVITVCQFVYACESEHVNVGEASDSRCASVSDL